MRRYKDNRTKKNYHTANKDYGLHTENPDVTKKELDQRVQDLYITLSAWRLERQNLKVRTRGHTNSTAWMAKIRFLVSASKMGKICNIRPTTSTKGKKTKKPLDFYLTMEPIEQSWLQDEGYDIRPCGLFLYPEILGRGASPDGLIRDDAILEIKQSFTGRAYLIDDVLKDKRHNITQAFAMIQREPVLKKNHNFYYQIQTQLRVTGRERS